MHKRVMAVSAAVLVAVPALAATAPANREAAPKKNLVETAQASPQFTTLVKLVKQAGLVKTLSGSAKYTVLAPTDAAFAKVPKATLTALGEDKAKLKQVLLYHVIEGRVPAAKVVKLKSATTVEGSKVAIRVKGKKVFVDSARVTKTDIRASNGIIHVLNRVLIPES
jgi:uncharacterized surface protein with fasciclin (FAS1) repeats